MRDRSISILSIVITAACVVGMLAALPKLIETMLGTARPAAPAAASAAAPDPAAAATAQPAPNPPAPPPRELALTLAGAPRRFAGGRPVAWWSGQLAKLRKDGPQDLYRLTLDRARLNGLEVVEKDGGEVTVAATLASPEKRL